MVSWTGKIRGSRFKKPKLFAGNNRRDWHIFISVGWVVLGPLSDSYTSDRSGLPAAMRYAAPGLARTGVTASLQVPGSGPRVVQDSLAVTRLHYGVPRGGASCKSTANFAGERGAEVLDLDEFRRGVGLCVFNNAGQVFAAR